MKITVSTLAHAPLAEVWRAYTTPEDIKQWNAASPDWHTTSAAVVEFVKVADGVTVTVTFDGETTHTEEQQRTGWQAILDNFARHVKARKAAPQGN